MAIQRQVLSGIIEFDVTIGCDWCKVCIVRTGLLSVCDIFLAFPWKNSLTAFSNVDLFEFKWKYMIALFPDISRL